MVHQTSFNLNFKKQMETVSQYCKLKHVKLFFNMKMFLTAIIVNVHIFYHLVFMQLGHAKGLVDFRWTHPVKLKVLSFLPHSFYPAH